MKVINDESNDDDGDNKKKKKKHNLIIENGHHLFHNLTHLPSCLKKMNWLYIKVIITKRKFKSVNDKRDRLPFTVGDRDK